MSYESALIIFKKNLLYGKVKTRLAATIGNARAFDVYKKLISHTYSVAKQVTCDSIVYYSSHIEKNDEHNFYKEIQYGNNLGERMKNAFNDVFQKKYSKVIIIGSDCPQLNCTIVNEAFEQLNNVDVVIGPAADGGYYLLGMKQLYTFLFENIEWSANSVFEKTVSVCKSHGVSRFHLPILHDVDVEEDLQYINF